MIVLLAALFVGILAYAVIVMLVPKAIPGGGKDENLKNALTRLYEENRSQETISEDSLQDELTEEAPFVRTLFSLPFMKPLHLVALQAGYQNNLQQVLLILIIHAAIVLGLCLALGHLILGAVIALPAGYYFAWRRCRRKFQKRNRKFIDQFPDALDMIVRSVRSGFPLSTALQMLSDNAEEPVREEFRRVVDDIALGRAMPQALGRLALRINETDIRFFVVVLSVQQETGGNLSEIIGNLSTVIRKRKQLRHRIKALTSEGVATGWVLGMLPVFVFGILYLAQPDYLEPFWLDPLGRILFGSVIGLLVLCFFIVRAMINIDI